MQGLCANAAIPSTRMAVKLYGLKKPKVKDLNKMDVKLYVGNLSFSTTEDELRTLFAQAGTVTSVALIKDRDTGTSKGFAFVEMSAQTGAENAIKMFNGYSLGNREIRVSPARPREETGRSGGGGGGYSNGPRRDTYGHSGGAGGPGGGRDRRGGNSRY
jgi:RNA recognition motif-containing protein